LFACIAKGAIIGPRIARSDPILDKQAANSNFIILKDSGKPQVASAGKDHTLDTCAWCLYFCSQELFDEYRSYAG
jgi:hypothetical protein